MRAPVPRCRFPNGSPGSALAVAGGMRGRGGTGRNDAFGADPAVLADVDGDAVGADVLRLEVPVAEGYVGQTLGAERVELAVGGLGIFDDEAKVAHAAL